MIGGGEGSQIGPAHPGIVGIGCIAMVAMAEIRHHKAHLADLALPHHLAHLADHRIGRIAVVHRADFAAGFGDLHDLLALLHGHGHGLLAQHIEPRLK